MNLEFAGIFPWHLFDIPHPFVSESMKLFDKLSLDDKNIQEVMCYDELENQMVELIEHLPVSQRDILKMRIFKDRIQILPPNTPVYSYHCTQYVRMLK